MWADVDEHERDVFDKDGYFDVGECEQQISASDMELLNKFATKQSGGGTLADLIS